MFSLDTGRDVLTPDQLDQVHERAMTVLEEIGTDVRHPAALEMLAGLGQKIDGERVHWDREFVMEMLARAPHAFTLRGRNPERSVRLGDGKPVLTPVGGSPFCSDLERGRRDGTYADHVELVKMAQAADLITCNQSGTVEAGDLDENSRHMDMDYSVLRYSDKPHVCYGTSGPKARDAVALAAIACGGREAIEQTPALMGIVNPNSPLVWDFLMVDALSEWASAGQPVVITPFLLAGATAPITIASGLVLKVAEALSGVALVQAIRPGTPAPVRIVLHRRGHAHRRPRLRHARVGAGDACRRPAGAALRPALPGRRRPLLVELAGHGVSGGDDHDPVGDDVVRLAPGDARRRLARGRPDGVVREVRARPRAAADVRDDRRGHRHQRGAVRDRRDAGGRAGRDVPGRRPHARALQGVDVHEPAVPLAGLRDLAEAGLAQPPTTLATAEWKKLLESYEDPGIDPAVDEELQEYMQRRRAEIEAAL